MQPSRPKRTIEKKIAQPEGPYESGDIPLSFGTSSRRMEQFVDFVEQLEEEVSASLSIKQGYSEIKLMAHLLRNHLTGKLTTSSSLSASSGLTYGTASRAIQDILDRGLIVKRQRTNTGRSFSLHPTEKFLKEWEELARRTHSLLHSTIKLQANSKHNFADYFYGASYSTTKPLGLPSILDNRLNITGSLRMLVHADPTFMAMSVLKKQFETIFGVPITIKALSIDRLHSEIIDNAKRKTSSYDIIASDLPWFGEFAKNDHLLPCDDYIVQDNDIHQVARDSTKYKGRYYGVPVQTTPELLVYRKDILENAGLEAPTTTAQTLKVAQALHNPFENMHGIAWNAARGTPLGHSFLFVMAAFGQPVINLRKTSSGFDCTQVVGEENRPMLDSLAAYETAEYLKELLDYSPKDILTMAWYDRARYYADGEAAMAYCATLLSPMFETNEASPAFGKTGYLPHPHGPQGHSIAPIGGYALAVPTNIDPVRINPIWTCLSSLTSASAIKLYLENGSLVSPRYSVSLDPEARAISPLISIVDDLARNGVLQLWPRPPIPEISQIIAIIGGEVHDMLSGAKSTKKALETAQERIDMLMRANGHY